MILATKLVKGSMKISMFLRLSWLKFPCSFRDKLVERNCRKEHGNFHVPYDHASSKEHGNFHVPCDEVGLKGTWNFHVPRGDQAV